MDLNAAQTGQQEKEYPQTNSGVRRPHEVRNEVSWETPNDKQNSDQSTVLYNILSQCGGSWLEVLFLPCSVFF